MRRKIDRRYIISIAALVAAAFLLMMLGAARSQEIDECLECHSDRNLTEVDAAGNVHSLYVDKKLFLASAHGKLNYTCMECHTEATLDHPAGGVPKAKCEECHEESQAKYVVSEHGKLLASGNAKAPHCYDCHSMHYTFSSDNPRSTTNPNNIPETCGACHEEQVKGPGFIESFIVTRLKGHGKQYLASGDFRISRCSNCHFEVANHGKKEKVQPVCAKCHELCNSSINLGPIHKSDVFTQTPMRVAVKMFYGFGLAMIVFAFMSMAGKKYTQTNADEQQTPEH